MTTINNGDAVGASNSAQQLESESLRLVIINLQGLIAVLSEMVKEMRDSRQQGQQQDSSSLDKSRSPANPITPETFIEGGTGQTFVEGSVATVTPETVVEGVTGKTVTSSVSVSSTASTYIEEPDNSPVSPIAVGSPATTTIESSLGKKSSVVLPPEITLNGFAGVNKAPAFSGFELNTQPNDPTQQITALYAIKQTLTDPNRIPDEGVRNKFSGLEKLLQGVKEIASSITTAISKGIERLKENFNSRSLADELKRQSTVTEFANRILDSAGHRGEDGKTIVQGANYRFERDTSGSISITDTSKQERGQLFSLKDGVLHDKLQPKDLNNFLKAAEVLKSQQQTQGAER
ncbi:MAG: hypothetical protein N5P05_002708 [Chroococcopsis gigantea SAG 12.99]|jgi:hypothetical protein|nr:hypothetical protein [Chlorogloea purpurea SAG 13.99]MDV3001102.1 hypothetical protein [Chroococcopsis gigantea SAG 12.99]